VIPLCSELTLTHHILSSPPFLSSSISLTAVFGTDKWGVEELRYDLEIIASLDHLFSLDYSFGPKYQT